MHLVSKFNPNNFPGVNWNHCAAAIGVAQKMMTPFTPDDLKAGLS